MPGVTIPGPDGASLGHLSVYDSRPLENPEFFEQVLRLFANRASTEIMRLRAVDSSRLALQRLETFTEEFPGWALAYKDYLNGHREIVFSNTRCEDLFGPNTAAQIMADPTSFRTFIHPDDLPDVLARHRACRARNEQFQMDYRFKVDSGEYRWMRVVARYTGQAEDVKTVHSIMFDIENERRLSRQAVELSHQVGILIEAVPMAVILRDSAGTIQFMNGSARQILSLKEDEWPGQTFASLHDLKTVAHSTLREIAQLDQAAWQSRERIDRHILLHGASPDKQQALDCSWVPLFDDSGDRLGLVTTLRDVTEAIEEQRIRLHLQETDQRDRRMDALGRLAEGVSHEFENLLTAVLGYSDICLSRLGAEDENTLKVKDSLEKIQAAASKASELSRSLLAFSARKHWKGDSCNPAEILREFAPSLSHLAGSQVTLETNIHSTENSVSLSREDLADILVHLVSNAREALNGRGTIRLSGYIRLSDQPLIWRQHSLPAGKYYLIEVADDGVGIADADLGQIFDPFFTTSPEVRGRGMGLAMVFGLVNKTGGGVQVQSQVGGGTCMQVFLPLTKTTVSPTTSIDGSEALKILIVEDQPSLLDLFTEVLQAGGHQTTSASSIKEAVAKAKSAVNLDLLVCDIFLSDGNGVELLEQIRDIQAEIPVVFFSGTPRSNLQAQGICLPDDAPLLSKPFRPTQLLQTIARFRK